MLGRILFQYHHMDSECFENCESYLQNLTKTYIVNRSDINWHYFPKI